MRWGTDNILWLPLEYRGTEVAVHRNIFALGGSTGMVTILGFDLDHIPR